MPFAARGNRQVHGFEVFSVASRAVGQSPGKAFSHARISTPGGSINVGIAAASAAGGRVYRPTVSIADVIKAAFTALEAALHGSGRRVPAVHGRGEHGHRR